MHTNLRSFCHWILAGWACASLGMGLGHAQTRIGLIYGEVQLKNGQTYRGHLRWAQNDEASWEDIFNGYKYDLPIQTSIGREEAQRITNAGRSFKFDFMALWEDKNPDVNFSFKCNYGDLVRLDWSKPNLAIASLKNGDRIRLKRNRGDDVSSNVHIFEESLGTLRMRNEDLKYVRFMAAPPNSRHIGGRLMYGEVFTTSGTFEGFIGWDQEESLGRDLINGSDKGVSVELQFKSIASIKAEKDGSLVRLISGKNMYLDNHDDVNRGNHGILIRSLPYGKVLMDWDKLISAQFKPAPHAPRGYDSFLPPNPIQGAVYTHNGARYDGKIIYDQDENLDIEFLDGTNNGFTYFIPFREIDSIVPQNFRYSLVTLKSGESLLLGNHPDVASNNNGLVVVDDRQHSVFIPWEDVKEIDLDEVE